MMIKRKMNKTSREYVVDSKITKKKMNKGAFVVIIVATVLALIVIIVIIVAVLVDPINTAPSLSRMLSMDHNKIPLYSSDRIHKMYPFLSKLESKCDQITFEFERFIQEGYKLRYPTQDLILNQEKGCKNVVLKAHGIDVTNNSKHFPITTSLLNQEKVLGCSFSILEPHTRVSSYKCKYNGGTLRYQLGLKVPRECGLFINGKDIYWKEGSGIMYDDSYEKEMYNDSDGIRLVLTVDLSKPITPILQKIHSKLLKYLQKSKKVRNEIRDCIVQLE